MASGNYLSYVGHLKQISLRQAWATTNSTQHASRLGLLLICGGMLLLQNSWLERGLWLVAGSLLGYSWLEYFKRQNNNDIKKLSPVLEVETPLKNKNNTPPIILHGQFWKVTGTFLERTRLLWLIGLLPLFLLAQGHYLLLGVGGVAFLWGWVGLTTGYWGRTTPVDWSLLVWLLLLPLTLAITPDLKLTMQFLGYFLAQLLAFYGVATWVRSQERLYLTAWGLLLAGTLLALLAPVLVLQTQKFFHLPTALITLHFLLELSVNANVMSGTLVILLPLGVALTISQFQSANGWLKKLVALSATILIGGVVVIIQSRGAYVALAIALLVLFYFANRGAALLTLGGLILAAGFVVIILLVFNQTKLEASSLQGVNERLEIWARAIASISDFPLTGIGFGTFTLATSQMYPFYLIDVSNGAPPHAHNLFLQVGVDLGVGGLISYIALLLNISVSSLTQWKQNSPNWIILGSFASLSAFLVYGLTDAISWGTRPAFLGWAVLGLLLAGNQNLIQPNSSGSGARQNTDLF
jgi:putative inorganic carbon (HCO3(-)) transporter